MEQVSTASPAPDRQSRRLPLLVLLFAGSGCSALIYEIVWFQLLQLAIGSTSVSMGVCSLRTWAAFASGVCCCALQVQPASIAGVCALEAGSRRAACW